jgi:hypothetical protein
MPKRRKLTCSSFLRLQGMKPVDARARLAERDARMAADTRTELQKLLGEPEPSRSALAQSGYVTGPASRSASGTRVDLWKR